MYLEVSSSSVGFHRYVLSCAIVSFWFVFVPGGSWGLGLHFFLWAP